MRGENDIGRIPQEAAGRRRLLLGGVDARARQGSRAHRLAQRLLVDDAAAGDDDEVGGALHQADATAVDQAPRLAGEGSGHHEPVGHPQQVVQSVQAPDLPGVGGGPGELVHGIDLHFEATRPPGHPLTDVSEAQDSEYLALQVDLPPGVVEGAPLPCPLLVQHLVQLLGEGGDEGEDVGRHGAHVGLAGVGDGDVAGGDLRDAEDAVDPGTGAVDPLEVGGGQIELARRPPAEYLGIGRGGQLFFLGLAPDEVDPGKGGLQVPDHHVVGLAGSDPALQRCNDDFHHRSSFFRSHGRCWHRFLTRGGWWIMRFDGGMALRARRRWAIPKESAASATVPFAVRIIWPRHVRSNRVGGVQGRGKAVCGTGRSRPTRPGRSIPGG